MKRAVNRFAESMDQNPLAKRFGKAKGLDCYIGRALKSKYNFVDQKKDIKIYAYESLEFPRKIKSYMYKI